VPDGVSVLKNAAAGGWVGWLHATASKTSKAMGKTARFTKHLRAAG
jgi:hypothetical protein